MTKAFSTTLCVNLWLKEIASIAVRLYTGLSITAYAKDTEPDSVVHAIPTDFGALELSASFNFHELLGEMLDADDGIPVLNKTRALFWAAKGNSARNIITLLKSGAEPNVQISNDQAALTVAAEKGHVDCVTALLADQRTDINARGRGGRTALSFACSNGYFNIVRLLLGREDCLPDHPDALRATPLLWAAEGGQLSILLELTRHAGVDVNHRDNKGQDDKGRSSVSWPAGSGCRGTTKLLMKNKRVDKATLDHDRRGAISWESAGGHSGVLRLLLKSGCPGVADKDVDGWNPLASAIQNHSPDTIEALMSTGSINLEDRDQSGRTELSWAVEYGHFRVVRRLLNEGADLDIKTNGGRTPFDTAESLGRYELLNELKFLSQQKNQFGDGNVMWKRQPRNPVQPMIVHARLDIA